MPDRYKNISDHPLDLDDGRTVASGDFIDIKSPGSVAQSHIDAGTLVSSFSRGAAREGEGSKSSRKKGGS